MKWPGFDPDVFTPQDPEVDAVDIFSRLNIDLDSIALVEFETAKDKCRADRVVLALDFSRVSAGYPMFADPIDAENP